MEDLDWTDKRPLAALNFGITLPEAERPAAAEKVRGILADMGVTIAEDIKVIGCTTLATKLLAGANGNRPAAIAKAVADGNFLRMALGGSGIGLTCYVPPTRFCLVHNTVGGLQDNQALQDVEMIDHISRELTGEERVKTGLVEHVRRNMDEDSDKRRADVLGGRKLPPEFAPGDAVGPGAGPVILAPPADPYPDQPLPWACLEHEEFTVACRFCLAQAIVTGPLQPTAILVWGEGTEDEVEQLPLVEVATKVAALNESGVDVVALYIKASRWTRRLARE